MRDRLKEKLKRRVKDSRLKYNEHRSFDSPKFFPDDLQRILDAIDAAFDEPEELTCVWEYSAKHGHWNTECRCSKTFTGGGNPYTFCPFCHGKIVEIGGPEPEPKPKYDGQINCQKCGIRHPIGQPCRPSYCTRVLHLYDQEAPDAIKANTQELWTDTGTGEPDDKNAELEVAFEMITQLRERLSRLEEMFGGKSPFPKCPSCGRSVVAKVNTRHEVRTYKCENKSCITDTIRIERN